MKTPFKMLVDALKAPRSALCPRHGRGELVQSTDRELYVCTCEWDACTTAQLGEKHDG